jgi:hypothetical protein
MRVGYFHGGASRIVVPKGELAVAAARALVDISTQEPRTAVKQFFH